MACVILINVTTRNERNRVLDCLDNDINYEVITDMKKYIAQKYKGRFVEKEEVGGGGDSTQITTIAPVENKDIPLLESMSQNDRMTETEGNASTNLNTVVPEDDGYGTFIPYRYRMVEPKEENDVAVRSIAGNNSVREEIDNECIINPISVSTGTIKGKINNESHTDDIGVDVPYLGNLVEMEQDITEDGDRETGNVTVNNGSDVASIDVAPVTSINDEPSTSTKRRSGRVTKRQRYLTDDEKLEGENDHSQKRIAKSPQQASKKKKSVIDSSNGSDAVSVADSSIADDTPSTSTRRRSGRGIKRPKYATDDEESDGEDEGSVAKKKNSILKQQSRKKSGTTRIECKKCLKQLNTQCRRYSQAKEHAITHTDIKRYKCLIEGCAYRNGSSTNMMKHLKRVHKVFSLKPKEINLTDEQEDELDQMIKECFPEFGDEYKVCNVCQVAVSNNSLNQYHPKRHAIQHIDFMRYKCNQEACRYESKYCNDMSKHLRYKHGMEGMSKEEHKIELTDDQKKDIDNMFKRCFPNENEIVDEQLNN